MQLRCGHFPLNGYLHRINKVESDRCQECLDEHDDNLTPPETINHFLFDCPAHNIARDELSTKIDKLHFSLSDLMTDTDHMKALTTYINRTGRFRE